MFAVSSACDHTLSKIFLGALKSVVLCYIVSAIKFLKLPVDVKALEYDDFFNHFIFKIIEQ